MLQGILTVTELTGLIKQSLEHDFPAVWVKGQVSNLARPASGHVYFTLKDAGAALAVVWFRQSRFRAERVDPLTGEVFTETAADATLADGKEILCGGRLTVYPPRGVYQLVATSVQDLGVGRLHQEFEALKQRYAALGWFDQARKRPLPRNPQRVAVVTAPGSAALEDFLRLTRERGHGGSIRVYASLVQGEQAPTQLARALERANAPEAGSDRPWAEVVVLIRGGGSLEDLWAFNTEPVAEAVYRSRLPVLAGIGHEVDVSIADLVADLRAATPSHAAQLLYEERETLAQGLDGRELALTRAWQRRLQDLDKRLAHLERGVQWFAPHKRLERATEVLGRLQLRLDQAGARLPRQWLARVTELAGRLTRAWTPARLTEQVRGLERLAQRLEQAQARRLEQAGSGLDRLALKLDALDPERPLLRGYALVSHSGTGRYLRSAGAATPGELLDVRLRDGELAVRVEGVKQEGNEA